MHCRMAPPLGITIEAGIQSLPACQLRSRMYQTWNQYEMWRKEAVPTSSGTAWMVLHLSAGTARCMAPTAMQKPSLLNLHLGEPTIEPGTVIPTYNTFCMLLQTCASPHHASCDVRSAACQGGGVANICLHGCRSLTTTQHAPWGSFVGRVTKRMRHYGLPLGKPSAGPLTAADAELAARHKQAALQEMSRMSAAHAQAAAEMHDSVRQSLAGYAQPDCVANQLGHVSAPSPRTRTSTSGPPLHHAASSPASSEHGVCLCHGFIAGVMRHA